MALVRKWSTMNREQLRITREVNPSLTESLHIEIRRMWAGGPFRQWSETRTNGTRMPHAQGGFVGSYVCEVCERSHATESIAW
jgi:hypothetical protein